MGKIKVPKSFSKLLQEVDPKNFIPLLGKYGATDTQGRYWHWNDFQWRVQQGDDELAAWIATKYARKTISKELQLLEAEGDRYFSYCVPDSLFAQLHLIDKMTGGGQKISDGIFVSSEQKNR
ncbi:conserved hypothetical protein [Rippkaea orientalis PCC 8801]|uniref:Uncharacterized protein n=1 Tax=Rippkaea orientalis (strain PCC 8801 / RF-1) TaxID=41431 RepID=B7K542_RIPO1|nr:hypothetical protein [Rippkaea orientalis]ACK67868.1 conserved hypothetical protein [Rippkaea orientalis PCC 8801]